MDEKKAERLAREFLSQNLKLNVYSDVPSGISAYPLDLEDVILVEFSLFADAQRFGSDQFVAVSKIDGSVHYIGHQSE